MKRRVPPRTPPVHRGNGRRPPRGAVAPGRQGTALIAFLDTNMRFVWANRACGDWLGVPRDRIDGLPIRDAMGDAAADIIAPRVELAMAGQETSFEETVAFPGSEPHRLRGTCRPALTPGGRIRGVILRVVRAREPEREGGGPATGQEPDEFFIHSPLSTQILSPDGKTVAVNRAWEALWGMQLGQLAGYSVLDDPQLEALGVLDRIKAAFAGSDSTTPVFTYDPAASGLPGRARTVHYRIYPVKDPAGRVVQVVIGQIDSTELESAKGLFRDLSREAREAAGESLRRLRILEAVLRSLPEPIAVFDAPAGVLRFANEAYLRLFGVESDAIGRVRLEDLAAILPMYHSESAPDEPLERQPVFRALRHGETIAREELIAAKRDGTRLAMLSLAAPALDEKGNIEFAVVAFRDVTANRQITEALRASEHELRTLAENTPDLIARFDPIQRYTFANPAFERMSGIPRDQLIGKTNAELSMPSETESALRAALGQAGDTMQETRFDFGIRGLFGDRQFQGRIVPELGQKGQLESFLLVARDITEVRQAEEHIRFVSFHDPVTGLYTRTFLEEEIARMDTERELPISVIAGDTNNLKLMNDAFGHEEGDRLLKSIAGIVRQCCRDEDIVARWGGDEFVVLLPKTPLLVAEEIARRVMESCGSVRETVVPPSIALGVAAKTDAAMDLQEVMREAEARMYEHKALESRRTLDLVLRALRGRLEASGVDVGTFLVRVVNLVRNAGRSMGLNDQELVEVESVALLHELGKVAVPETLIMKPGPLDEEEWRVMRKHAQTGFRIARAADAYAHLANTVHCIHERWDGKGYPRGLAGEGIPLVARVLAIAIAFDVMTHNQPYREKMSVNKAIDELDRNAGSQFDPTLVREFARQIPAQV